MNPVRHRLGGEPRPVPREVICDSWLSDAARIAHAEGNIEQVVGSWPAANETAAVDRLAEVVGATTDWTRFSEVPPIAPKLEELARMQPLDLAIVTHLPHLQRVCSYARSYLRVEEERTPVSRAKRVPARAVADLVARPGDWEHRTLKSIQPSRVLARAFDEDWNVYENRVAVRLVDHLIRYVRERLEELGKIKDLLGAAKEVESSLATSSHWRSKRITEIWSHSESAGTDAELIKTMGTLRAAASELRGLMDSLLYRRIPARENVSPVLRATNILTNDFHYRCVALLWRAWVRYAHKAEETREESNRRRLAQGRNWDQFVRHLTSRALTELGWNAEARDGRKWSVTNNGYGALTMTVDDAGVLRIACGNNVLTILPVCCTLDGSDQAALARLLAQYDAPNTEGEPGVRKPVEVVLVHAGSQAAMQDLDRASGWSFDGRAVLLHCSPWNIDSLERMARLVEGWIQRSATLSYPLVESFRPVPEFPECNWLLRTKTGVAALRRPSESEIVALQSWVRRRAELLEKDQRGRRGGDTRADPVAERRSLARLAEFLGRAGTAPEFDALCRCPQCDDEHSLNVEPRPDVEHGSFRWWATCQSCETQWGRVGCVSCGTSFGALHVPPGETVKRQIPDLDPRSWPDAALGRDCWAQICQRTDSVKFRCPKCGSCSRPACSRCNARSPAPASP